MSPPEAPPSPWQFRPPPAGWLHPHSLNSVSDLHLPHLLQQARHDSAEQPGRAALWELAQTRSIHHRGRHSVTLETAWPRPLRLFTGAKALHRPFRKEKMTHEQLVHKASKPGGWGKGYVRCLTSQFLTLSRCLPAQRLRETLQATKTHQEIEVIVTLGTCIRLNLWWIPLFHSVVCSKMRVVAELSSKWSLGCKG